jgi:hypothetical protein
MRDTRHALAEERSLQLHRVVAERLRGDPRLLDRARKRVRGWLRDGPVGREWAEAWLEILERPLDDITALLIDTGQRARDLRQSSPFAGVIDPRTRWTLLRSVRRRNERP